jgi:hypothetical protein
MSKVFKYEKIIGKFLLEDTDEYEEIAEEFDYEVEDKRLFEALADCIYRCYFKDTDLAYRVDYLKNVTKGIEKFIKDACNLYDLVEVFEEELKNYFEEEAMEELQ